MTTASRTESIRKYRALRIARRCSQLFFLGLFFFLFIKTDYTGSDRIEYAVNILFRIDPLLALSTILAAKVFIALMAPALIVLLLAAALGRSFCGWFCPVGAMLDGAQRLTGSGKKETGPTMFPRLAIVVLLFIIVSSVLNVPLAGYLDPFSILVRALTQAIYPALNSLAVSFFTFTYESAPPAVNVVTEPVYSFMKQTILPFEQKYYDLALLSLLMFAALFAAEFVQRRFFCRNICPLGALIGLVSRRGVLKVGGGDTACGKCIHCRRICRMGAIDEERNVSMGSCIVCMDCLVECPRQVIGFSPAPLKSGNNEISLSRRQFVTTLAAGAMIPPILSIRNNDQQQRSALIRPPGAREESEFLNRCVRCAECIQVCIGNALQPAFLQSGIEGIFSPRLVARSGYCEFNCTLCGQVCPTGAIQELSLEEKHRTKIGHAWFDQTICLPYAKGIPCIVCEEHCPTPDKAIKFRIAEVYDDQGQKVRVKQPYVVDSLCIGCGICETKCPVYGRAAVYVTSAGEDRDTDNILPAAGGAGPY
ncbi:MAG: 4Fe-4S binding protein [Desulfocapsaceae bacterium]|nr:4Fe-4S binding protein [Desulfocapsaceae bacterium]